jgi:SAM-dependent methyltransferase
MSWRTRADCRLCTATPLRPVLDLAPTPPANELVRDGDPPQELIPLHLAACVACGHVQLPVVVDPQRLFGAYRYVSGTAPSFVDHFRRYAEAAIAAHGLRPGDLVVEVGSNDGTLLRFFKEAGMRVVGVDPATAIAERATLDGIETWPRFFDRQVARKIHEHYGPAALVLANNVFAHADDLAEIALGVRDLLDLSRGRFIFEVQYLVDLVEQGLFDMVYHEHLSYHHVGPLLPFFSGLSMRVVDAEHVPTHGGSIRVTVAPRSSVPAADRLEGFLRVERAALAGDPWGALRRRIDDAGEALRGFLTTERQAGRPVAGYGAPAKLTTLCHQFGITRSDVAYVIDDSPWKQGMLAPGTRIPIVPPSEIYPSFALGTPASIVVFAWNFAEQIAAKLRAAGYRGRIVTPLPTFKELA